MTQLQCKIPDVIVSKPQGLSQQLFFQVFSGPNAIAFAQLSSRADNRHRRSICQTGEEEKAPGVSYCLKNIEVSPNYRNKGIGTALLEEIIRYCKDERVSSLYGEAVGEKEILRRWYSSKGFDLDSTDNIQLSLA